MQWRLEPEVVEVCYLYPPGSGCYIGADKGVRLIFVIELNPL